MRPLPLVHRRRMSIAARTPIPGPIPAAQVCARGAIALRSRGHCVITALPNRVACSRSRPSVLGMARSRARFTLRVTRGIHTGETTTARGRANVPPGERGVCGLAPPCDKGRAVASQGRRLARDWLCDPRHAVCSGQDGAGGAAGMQGTGMQGTGMTMAKWPRARSGNRLRPLPCPPGGAGHWPKVFGLPRGWIEARVGSGASMSAP
jgi:hypothetical protein